MINPPAEGTILLEAMVGFVIAKPTEKLGTVLSLLLWFESAALVSAAIAPMVAFGCLNLSQQVST